MTSDICIAARSTFETKEEVEAVVENLLARLRIDGKLSASDYKRIVDSDNELLDFPHYGWTSLKRMYVTRNRDGYQLVMPLTERI